MLRSFVALFALILCLEVSAISMIQSQSTVTLTQTSQEILAKNLRRNYLLIINNSGGSVYLKYDLAHTGSEGIVIPPGGNYEPQIAPANSIYAFCDAASCEIRLIEGEK